MVGLTVLLQNISRKEKNMEEENKQETFSTEQKKNEQSFTPTQKKDAKPKKEVNTPDTYNEPKEVVFK